MCTRTADYENFVPKRSCLPPTESYLSTGSEVLLKYTLVMRRPNVVFLHYLLHLSSLDMNLSILVHQLENRIMKMDVVGTSPQQWQQLSSKVTMTFDVSGMRAFEDFEDFYFEVRFRFIPPNDNEQECGVLPESIEKTGRMVEN
ncbi:CUB domain-containing protein [Caerostris extrusa]|uniref:CUB domain-containing protein n=1 Tax=Caerostris extrusa TaxID=172846 RepID=A0AAV4UCU2_CAEEX|nr:CUB domain-containing protein [Caerostris extrusa]